MNAVRAESHTRVPLSALRVSTLNVRKTGSGDVSDLVASIIALGLLNPLTVLPANDGTFGVVAGARRLRALQQLAKEGNLPADLEDVPCLVVDATRAAEASTAENVIRLQMHPADQFQAFQEMVTPKDGRPGKPIADVAAHFGVSELVVKRRLSLATVAPKLLQAFREDKLTLEQMMAYAVTTDHKAQIKHYESRSDQRWEMEPHAIRRSLVARGIPTTDRRVVFVGLDAYRAAGGAMHEDLFNDAGGGFVLDEKLLDKLAAQKVADAIAAVTAEGWNFVKTLGPGERAWDVEYNYNRSQPQREKRVLTSDEAAELKKANARVKELDAELCAADDEGGTEDDDPRVIELETLQARVLELERDVEVWSDRQKAAAGAIVYCDEDSGRLVVRRGLIPKSAKAERQVAAETGKKPEPKKPELSEGMIRRLTTHRTMALQFALLQQPAAALAVAADALASRLLYSSESKQALSISTTKHHGQHQLGLDDVTASPLCKGRMALIEKIRTEIGMPSAYKELLPWLLQQKQDVVCRVIGIAASMTLDATQGSIGPHPADAIAEAAGLNMADHWQPTAANYFSLVSSALGLEAVAERKKAEPLMYTAQIYAGVKLKKDELAGQCEQVMRLSGWLPKPLRGKGYSLKGGTKATAEQKAVATGKAKPASKAASKKAPAEKATKAPPKAAKKAVKKQGAK